MLESIFVENFRENTWDSLIYYSVAIANEYQLPDKFSDDDIVVDVGAHIGSFARAVLERGSSQIYAVEADLENYRIAARNLREGIDLGKVALTYGAVWRSDLNEDILYYESDRNRRNTGGGVVWGKKGTPVPKIAFDDFLMHVTDQGGRTIRLLKIDCEGSEWPILLTSERLDLLTEICGEFHEMGGEYDRLEPPFSIRGWSKFSVNELIRFLDAKGFETTFRRHPGYDGRPSRLGAFWSARTKRATGTRGFNLG